MTGDCVPNVGGTLLKATAKPTGTFFKRLCLINKLSIKTVVMPSI